MDAATLRLLVQSQTRAAAMGPVRRDAGQRFAAQSGRGSRTIAADADIERTTAPIPTLLAKVKQQEAQAQRGKLRIYFGSSAGVGKTYAMLAAARKLKSEGRDVLVGVVETHGRAETAALLDDLESLAPRAMPYRGKELTEFDLDAAIRRRPALILVDELAHSNVQGARHPKRWQDVEELLSAGIDVFTTLNVQHLDSLNDVVGGITNVRVWETIPDTVFDQADEVVLVDIPADELLARLKAGKVYVPVQADRAAEQFLPQGQSHGAARTRAAPYGGSGGR